MKNKLARLLRKAADKLDGHFIAPDEEVPLGTYGFNGGAIIYGAEAEDYIIVGMNETPMDDEHGGGTGFGLNNCVVSQIDGVIQRFEPDADELLHELARMLGYTLTPKRA